MHNEQAINKISELIINEIQPDKIILFGSYAYGTPTDKSDLDLLVIKDQKGRKEFSIEDEAQLNCKILNRRRTLGLKLRGDIFLMTEAQARAIAQVEGAITDALKRGVVLYENTVQ